MKSIVFIIVLIVMCSFGYTQNLVPNPDFEEYLFCPDDSTLDEIGNVDDCLVSWSDPNNGSSNYFNGCSSPDFFGVPLHGTIGVSGYQPSRSGEAYAGFGAQSFSFPQPDYFREYLHNQFTESMEADKCYYVEFYVNKSNISEYAMNIGLVFTDFEFDIGGLWEAKCFCEAEPQIEQVRYI